MECMTQKAEKELLERILGTNELAGKHGLALSREDAELLVAERGKIVQAQKQVQPGEEILPKLICTFCDSGYISQSNYVERLVRLQEIFYLFKNELADEISDDALLDFMKEQFETVCCGDMDYLEGNCMMIFVQAIKKQHSAETV